MTKKRFFEYDLIRAAAMLLIVFYHMNCEWTARGLESPLAVTKLGRHGYLGWMGVSLFILISGATQCISYERCPDLKTYYKKRWLSIFPSFYLAYFVCYLMGGLASNTKLLDPAFLFTLTGLDGYLSLFGVSTHYLVGEWFLGMILILYIVFPLLYSVIRRWPRQVLPAVCVYYLIMLQLYPAAERIDKDVILNAAVFMAGIYLFLYVKQVSIQVGAGAFLILILLMFAPMPEQLTNYLFAAEGIALYLVLMALGRVIDRQTAKAAVLFRKIVCTAAAYSYEIFLIHHVLIAVSLSSYQIERDSGLFSYLAWAFRILIVVGAAAWMINSSASPKLSCGKNRK